jgi:hypothetical protein
MASAVKFWTTLRSALKTSASKEHGRSRNSEGKPKDVKTKLMPSISGFKSRGRPGHF